MNEQSISLLLTEAQLELLRGLAAQASWAEEQRVKRMKARPQGMHSFEVMEHAVALAEDFRQLEVSIEAAAQTVAEWREVRGDDEPRQKLSDPDSNVYVRRDGRILFNGDDIGFVSKVEVEEGPSLAGMAWRAEIGDPGRPEEWPPYRVEFRTKRTDAIDAVLEGVEEPA